MTTPFLQNDYRKSLALAHLGWWGTVAFAILRAFNAIPIAYGSFGLLTLGLGVTASLSLSRMRLGKTITDVFEVGMNMHDGKQMKHLPTAQADELLRHLEECQVCVTTPPKVITFCDTGTRLIRLTLEERHGKMVRK